MAKASDNEFPSVLFNELGAAPTTPATGMWRLYTKAGGVYVVDDAGAETGPFGAVGAGGGYDEGTSFPGAPTNNDKFFRTDLDMLFFYNGTRWLSATLYREAFTVANAIMPMSANNNAGFLPTWSTDFDLWLETFYAGIYVATTNSGAHYWIVEMRKYNSAAAATVVANFTTAADAANTMLSKKVAIGSLLTPGTYPMMFVNATKSGSPGTLTVTAAVTYRLVGT